MNRLVRMMVAFALTGVAGLSAGMMGYASDKAVMGATMTLSWIHSDIIDTSEVNMN